MASLMRRTLVRTRAPILSSLRRMVPQVALGELGVHAERCDAARKPAHRPSKRTTAAAGWRASCRRSAVGEEVELALLNAVFHVAAGAIELLVEMPALVLLA